MRQLELNIESLGEVYSLISHDRHADGSGAHHYFTELAALAHLAHHQLRRPEDLGISRSHPQSQAPGYHKEAQRALKVELHELYLRSQSIRSTLEQLDPGVYQSHAAESEAELSGQLSSQTTNQLAS